MAQKYTVEEFMGFIKTFSSHIQGAALKAWNQQTAEIWGDAKERTPLVSGDLQDMSSPLKAVVGDGGITSQIVFRAPYAINIETGRRNGKAISLRPVGYQYAHRTKSRLGEIGFLSNAGKAGENGLVDAIKDVIDKEWNKG